MKTLSIVIPALDEAVNIPDTLGSIPKHQLRQRGWAVEVLVVDNGSTDGTAEVAREHGARVLVQPVRGYGNAYKAGFANAQGDTIATGDADLTYPFEILPDLLEFLDSAMLDFLSTNRLPGLRGESMSTSHVWGNRALTGMSRFLFSRLPFNDSQSGMWVFRRQVWTHSRVRSGGMAFSQEFKLAAHVGGFRCGEIAIDYRPRGGVRKLNSVRDGAQNAALLLSYRVRNGSGPGPGRIDVGRPNVTANRPHVSELVALPAHEFPVGGIDRTTVS